MSIYFSLLLIPRKITFEIDYIWNYQHFHRKSSSRTKNWATASNAVLTIIIWTHQPLLADLSSIRTLDAANSSHIYDNNRCPCVEPWGQKQSRTAQDEKLEIMRKKNMLNIVSEQRTCLREFQLIWKINALFLAACG